MDGRYRGLDQGYYYLRRYPSGDNIVWASEFDQNESSFDAVDYDQGWNARSFANVFFGQVRGDGAYQGDYFDVPKGRASWSGSLVVRPRDSRFEVEGAYATTLNSESRAPWSGYRSGFGSTQPRFHGEGFRDLTGTWFCDDGGTYYLRQVGDRVVWFGENGNRKFANVFDGRISGSRLRGRWVDVPKFAGGASSLGDIELEILDLPTRPRLVNTLAEWGNLRTLSQTGGFGGRSWNKVEFTNVDARLTSLRILETTERSGDEPYLWVIWAKVDGDSVDVLRPEEATVTDGPSSGHQENLRGRRGRIDLPRGTVLQIPPEYGAFRTRLRTFSSQNPSIAGAALPHILLIVVAWEEDATARSVVRDTFREVRRELRTVVEQQLREVLLADRLPDRERLEREIQSALVNRAPRLLIGYVSRIAASWNIGGAIDPDDMIGVHVLSFSLADLRGRVVNITRDFRTNYRLSGSVSAS
jgi:hypothetical protein